MANRYAVANGNWSATATWNGGTLPTAADDVFANNFTVTIDQNVTALSLRTEAATGINAGGGFTLAASYNITADLYAGTSNCVTFSANSPDTTTITGNLLGGTSGTNTRAAFAHTGTGTSTINGNLTGANASATGKVAGRISAAGTMNLNGNITGGAQQSTNYGLEITNNANVFVTGNLTSTGVSAVNITGGALTVTGTLTPPTTGAAATVINSANCSVVVNGNITTSGTQLASLITHVTSGSVTINGSITNNISTSSTGIATITTLSGTSNLTINGDVTQSATGTNSHRIFSSATSGTITIVGNITKNNPTASVFDYSGNGTLNITGDISNVVSGDASVSSISGNSTVLITGNILGNIGGSTSRATIFISNAPTITINGNVTGSSTNTSFPIRCTNTFTGSLTINGTVTAGTGAGSHAIQNEGTGTITATRVVGNGFGVGSSGISEAFAIYNSVTPPTFSEAIVQEFEFGSRGAFPVRGNCRIANSSSAIALFRNASGTQITLVDPSTLVTPPVVTDVRSGVTYNNGNLTGTLAVPPVNQVAAGVAVDNTVGTAALTQANVWDYALSSASSVAGSVGEKLKKTAIPADIIALG